MDHDADSALLRQVVGFLDYQTDREWRDRKNWGRLGRGGRQDEARDGDAGAAMVVDEDQTARDRAALGYDAPQQEDNPADKKTQAELDQEELDRLAADEVARKAAEGQGQQQPA